MKDKKFDKKKGFDKKTKFKKFESKQTETAEDGKDFTSQQANCFPVNNDASWYKADEVFAHNTANIPFSMRVGDNFIISGPQISGSGRMNSVSNGRPGVMVLHTIPNYSNNQRDISTTNNIADMDAINTAASGDFAFNRSANSGAQNVYQKSDLMLLQMAEGELIKAFSFATKVYGLVQYYSTTNKYVGKAICEAMYVDFDNILNNLAAYRASLNALLRKASVITVPHLDFFNRCFWLYRGVFSDDQDVEYGQYYTFEPLKLLKYEANHFTTGTSLGPVSAWKACWSSNGGVHDINAAAIISTLQEMVDALVLDDDVAFMCGDIRKAYGESNIYGFWQVPENYQVKPEYNEEALLQIRNADIVASKANDNARYFYEGQNGGNDLTVAGDTPAVTSIGKWLTHGPCQINDVIYGAAVIGRGNGYQSSINLNTSTPAQCNHHYLTIPSKTPSVDEVLEATRLRCEVERSTDSSSINTVMVVSGGTEVIWDVSITYFDTNGDLITSPYCSAENDPIKLARFSMFNCHPFILTAVTTTVAIATGSTNYGLWEYETTALINTTELIGIHNCATFGMFVPRQSFIGSNKK